MKDRARMMICSSVMLIWPNWNRMAGMSSAGYAWKLGPQMTMMVFCRKMEAPRADTTAGSLPAGYTGRYATLSTRMPTRAMLMAATPMAAIMPVHGPN